MFYCLNTLLGHFYSLECINVLSCVVVLEAVGRQEVEQVEKFFQIILEWRSC